MKICNVIEIYDNGEFVTIVTSTGSAIHLPLDQKHSITIEMSSESNGINVTIDLNQ